MERFVRWVKVCCLGSAFGSHTALAAEPQLHDDSSSARPAETAKPIRSAGSPQKDPPAPVECNEQASKLFSEADSAYDAGNTALARKLMQQVYDRCQLADYLFNLAELDRELGNCNSAVQNYRAFVTKDSLSPRIRDARAAIAELEPSCPSRAPEKQAPIATEHAEPALNPVRVLGWSFVGVGAAAALSAAYFAIASVKDTHAEQDFVGASRSRNLDQRSPWDPSLEDRARRDRALFAVSGIGSASLLTAGLILLTRPASDQRAEEPAKISVGFDAHGAFAAYLGAF